jgi:hypothetical protein
MHFDVLFDVAAYNNVSPMMDTKPPTKSMRLMTAMVLNPAARA